MDTQRRSTTTALLCYLFTSIALAGGLPKVGAEESADRGVLTRDLKFIPVIDFVELAVDALARESGAKAEPAEGVGPRAPRIDRVPDPTQQQLAIVESRVVGNTVLISDAQTNCLIAYGSAKDRALIIDLLDELDQRPTQVRIAAAVIRVQLGRKFKHGMDVLRTVEQITVGGEKVDLPKVSHPEKGGPVFLEHEGLDAAHFDALCDAIGKRSKGKAQVISRPVVVCASGTEAKIPIGERGGGSKEDVAISLCFEPFVNPGGQLRVEMALLLESTAAGGAVKGQSLQTSVGLAKPSVVALSWGVTKVGKRSYETLLLLFPTVLPGDIE